MEGGKAVHTSLILILASFAPLPTHILDALGSRGHLRMELAGKAAPR